MEYTIRRSTRARHVWLRFSPAGALVVVLPAGYDARRVPALLKEKRTWLEKTARRLEERRGDTEAQVSATIPMSVKFMATGEKWTVLRRPSPAQRHTARETSHGVLEIAGNSDDTNACLTALRRWLVRAARKRLEPWLRQLADENGFRIGRVSIRSQRTRWASCSRRGDMSLNVRLLFVEPELARHVLLHELCHTKHLSHSKRFWSLLGQYDQEYVRHRGELKAAWRQAPSWLIGRNTTGIGSVD
jgi:predicted metal-dependent hydrolase